MACLYVADCEFMGRNVVKFGVSKYDDPWFRLGTLASTRDTIFGRPLPLSVAASIRFPYFRAAIRLESVLKARAKKVFAVRLRYCPNEQLTERLELIGNEHKETIPSGEWLMRRPCKCSRCAIGEFLRFAVDAATESRWVPGGSVECLTEAELGWRSGRGYEEYIA